MNLDLSKENFSKIKLFNQITVDVMKWNEGHPQEDGQYLVCYGKWHEVRILTWNQYYTCWDDEEGDDNFCEPEEVSHWMPLPEKPKFD